MNDKEIVLYSIELVQSIRSNDLEKAIILVQNLNNIDSNDNIDLGAIIQLGSLINDYLNDTLLYVINNLQNIQVDEIKWFVEYKNILKASLKEQEEFLINRLNENLHDYQALNLISLAIHTNRYDLLDQIYNLVEKL